MASASLSEIVRYCDRTLRTAQIADFDGAVNGLQMENSGRVTRIAATVDGCLATVRLAVAAKVDLLIVHHGFFWSPTHPWTGPRREIVRLLIENNVAVYSSHLPLDAHPQLGNCAILARALGLKNLKPFFLCKGQTIGFKGTANISRAELTQRLNRAVGTKAIIIPGGPKMCRQIGVVTGGAGGSLRIAAADGVDTYVTGEGEHWTYAIAEELGLNVLYGGHYATETLGVKALAAELSKRFKVPWTFLDHPTGL